MQGVGVGALEALGLADDFPLRYVCFEDFSFFFMLCSCALLSHELQVMQNVSLRALQVRLMPDKLTFCNI